MNTKRDAEYWKDRYYEQQADFTESNGILTQRAEQCEREVAALREALRPFANFACDPPCGCHNCRARELLKPHAQGDSQ